MSERNNYKVTTLPVGPRVQGMTGVVLGSLVLAAHNFSLDLTVAAPNSLVTGTVLAITGLLQFSAGVRLLSGRCPTLATLYLSLSVLWGSLGAGKILEGLDIFSPDARKDALLPGYAVFLFLTLFLGIAATRECTLVGWICFLLSFSMVMEIVALFYPAGRWGAACYQALPVLLGLYYVMGWTVHYCTSNNVNLPGMRKERPDTGNEGEGNLKNDVLAFGYAMNVIPTCVLALFFVGATGAVHQAAPWMALAGLAQLLVSILSFRREDVFHGAVFSLTSTLWLGLTYGFLSALWKNVDIVPRPPFLASSILVLIFLIFFLLSFTQTIADAVFNLCSALFVLSLPTTGLNSTYLGVASILLLLISLYCTFALTLNSAFRRTLVPVGRSLLPEESLRGLFSRCRCARQGYDSLPSSLAAAGLSSSNNILGYSKYASADSLGFLSNAVTALAVALLSTGDKSLVLPWVIVPGGVIQFVAGSISFSRGKTFESTAFMVYSMMWLLWGSVRYSGVYRGSEGLGVGAGAASFLLFNLFVIFLSAVINKAWLVLSVVFEVVCVQFLLDALGVQTSPYFELVVMCVFGVVCVYCFCAHLLNGLCGEEVMSLGTPLLTLGRGRGRGGGQGCVMADARKANGVKQIADLLKDGLICGMPTDTVYVLVAACNRPAAVERAYRTKKQAEERPMSIWISQLSQLESAREEFGPLLWDFMKEAWPSSISLVIKRGPWLDRFGLGGSARYIGAPESIAIRIPDCTVATHLIDLVGPIAVTSANPSGEADTTHHSQVTAKLGENVDGVLCDGPSPENVASTVVNCTKIDEGELGFFRVGIVPKSRVLDIFDSVRRRQGRSSSASGRNHGTPRRQYGSTNAARTRIDIIRGVASDLAGIVVHAEDDVTDTEDEVLPQVAVVGGEDNTVNSLAFSTTNLLDLKS